MGMSTDLVIGHFLIVKDVDIDSIIYSPKFEDLVVKASENCYFSNSGNTIFHWNKHDDLLDEPLLITKELKQGKLASFKDEIRPLTDLLDDLGIEYEIVYGAHNWYN